MQEFNHLKIVVAGTGYVGLSMSVLLAQHHEVTAVDIVPEKVDLLNRRKSPIQDEYLEKYLAEKSLRLTATLMGRRHKRRSGGSKAFCKHVPSPAGVLF